jgi:hypothetical protein
MKITPILTKIIFSLLFVGMNWAQSSMSQKPDSANTPSPQPARTSPLARWLEVQTGTMAARYKGAEPSGGEWINQLQYYFLARGKFKLDPKGLYHVGFRVSTGRAFTFSWNSTGIGAGDLVTNFYVKELFFSASPFNGLEIQVGGIGFNRGESTEITSYSNNGYLMGERILLHRPDRLFFDEISLTGAFLGDLAKPSVFERFHRISRMNYHQFLVLKKIHKNVSLSADYSFQDGVETLRQGVKITLPKNPLLDWFNFENYQRVDVQPNWGCAFTLQKTPVPKITLAGGFANVDQNYGTLNSDRLGKGKRLFLGATYNFYRDFSLGGGTTKAFGNDFPVPNAARAELILMYDFQKALKRAKVF